MVCAELRTMKFSAVHRMAVVMHGNKVVVLVFMLLENTTNNLMTFHNRNCRNRSLEVANTDGTVRSKSLGVCMSGETIFAVEYVVVAE